LHARHLIVLIFLVGFAACSSQQSVDRDPATEAVMGGAVDSSTYQAKRVRRDGVGDWTVVGAQEFEAGRRRKSSSRKGRRVSAQVEESGFNLFGSPFGGASSGRGRRGRGGPKRCPHLRAAIARVTNQVACYESLFYTESSCSTTVVHDRVKTNNPHAGVGLCALETSPAIRAQNRRGPKCNDIRSTLGQIRCCVHLMQSTSGRYFGTVIHGKTPRCS
jgi:hypothetical protein